MIHIYGIHVHYDGFVFNYLNGKDMECLGLLDDDGNFCLSYDARNSCPVELNFKLDGVLLS